MKTEYAEVSINPASSGFGMFQVSAEPGDWWASESDLLAEIAGAVDDMVELTDGAELPVGVEDIRGNIQGQTPGELVAVFAVALGREQPSWCYCGIIAREFEEV